MTREKVREGRVICDKIEQLEYLEELISMEAVETQKPTEEFELHVTPRSYGSEDVTVVVDDQLMRKIFIAVAERKSELETKLERL